jgi:hypothetical protein
MFPAGHDMRIIAAVTRVAGGRAVVHRTFGRQKHAATARRADAGAHIRNDAEVNERGDVVKRRRNAVNRRSRKGLMSEFICCRRPARARRQTACG